MMKKPIVSFVGHVGALLALCAFSGQEAYARHLQPEEAISMVRTGAMRSVSSARLKLAYTQKSDASVSTVYVFDREGAPGFYVLAADDAVGDIVLGYSHTGSFSADNMAPGMKWLLGVYSAQVSRCAEAAAPAGPKKVPQGLQAVTPLMSTTWNQYEPYNDMCP
ncbi:MAG: Spi family protease inhibitor, partial [Muribaculaceae bacterium]|nr:Spi family protease inhibitor [Muribaculaceae bacterium]